MKTAIAAIALIGSIATSAPAADLFLRPAGAEGGSSMVVGLDETAAIEIVVRLEADEELGFANIFLDVDDDNPIEALDFVPGLDVPPAVYTSHEQVLQDRFGPFPYSPGEGISPDDYALILDTGGVVGPGTFVLERIEVFGSAVGVGRVAFEFGARPPALFNSDFGQYPVATKDFPPGLSNITYVGIGDDRDGEAGPLVVTVEQESPSPPPPPGGDNGNDNDNGSDDPPDQDPIDNDNDAPDDGAPSGNNNDNTPDPGDQPPDDGDTPIDPAGDDNENGSDGSADNANSGDGGPNDPDDQPGGPDVPQGNDNTGGSSPPPTSSPCGFGLLPGMVSLLVGLGITRRKSGRRFE